MSRESMKSPSTADNSFNSKIISGYVQKKIKIKWNLFKTR